MFEIHVISSSHYPIKRLHNKWISSTNRTIEAERDEHEEEYDRPERGASDGGDRLRVHDEYQTGTYSIDMDQCIIIQYQYYYFTFAFCIR